LTRILTIHNQRAAQALEALDCPSLRRVINPTSVVLHTNLFRPPVVRVDLPASETASV
jgi:hypothetical protein